MKRLSEQNYYEILEVSYRATWGEIQKAYELARKTYGPDSIASYSLFALEDREGIFKRVEEAYQTLSDQEKRRRYDEGLAKVVQELAGQVPVASVESPQSPESPATEDPLTSGEVTGKVLKQIREKRGISIQEIADRTRINITYLYFLEEDNFRSLPAEVYLRSYLAQYARILHLDAKTLVEGYMKIFLNWQKQKADKE
jgi:curved DNA-binding protein CbpA